MHHCLWGMDAPEYSHRRILHIHCDILLCLCIHCNILLLCLCIHCDVLLFCLCIIQLGKMRMTVPCRASTCNHLQCFDAPTFLQMNEKKPTWLCPVCDKAAQFQNLIIDV